MKANELRIGNFVKDRGGKILRIDWFEQDKVCMEMRLEENPVHPLTEYFNYLRPIPLTPQILFKAGFVNHRQNEYLLSMQPDFHLSISFIVQGAFPCLIKDAEMSFENAQIIGLNEIKYLHNLQNLVHSLTGEELNIEL
jgi:hypothetical protein